MDEKHKVDKNSETEEYCSSDSDESFCQLVREIGQSIRANISWQSTAIFALQNTAEDYMV